MSLATPVATAVCASSDSLARFMALSSPTEWSDNATGVATGGRLMIVDSAIYVDGKRVEAPGSLEETYEACQAAGGIAWIGLYKPTDG